MNVCGGFQKRIGNQIKGECHNALKQKISEEAGLSQTHIRKLILQLRA